MDAPTRIDGWKAIAAHFRRNRSTVARWAEAGDFPVRRVAGRKGASVWAWTHELDAWHARTEAVEDPGARGVDADGSSDPDQTDPAPVDRPGRRRAFKAGRAWLMGAPLVAAAALAAWMIGGGNVRALFDPGSAKLPRYIVWEYSQGKASDAPNGLRFWEVRDKTVWNESFADGKLRNKFTIISPFHFDKTDCDGILLRKNAELLAFIPDDRCPQRYLMAEDINPDTGVVTRPWFILGRIDHATY